MNPTNTQNVKGAHKMHAIIKKIVGRMRNRQSDRNDKNNNRTQCARTERNVASERRIHHARNMQLIHLSVCEL
jgi:hypothetical protein